MKRINKVVTRARLNTKATSAPFNRDATTKSILVGSRCRDESSPCGLFGKVIEMSAGYDILDYGMWLDLAFPHVIGVFGTRGMGKSFTLGALAECVAGLESVTDGVTPSAATVLLDVQNQFWTMSYSPSPDLVEDEAHLSELQRWGLLPTTAPDVRLWTPCGGDPHLPTAKVFRLSPEQLRTDDWLAVLDQERYTAIGQALVELLESTENQLPAMLVENARPEILTTFQPGTVDALRWRLQAVAEMGLIGEPGVDVAELLTPGCVSVFLLRNLPENMRSLVVGVLARVLGARMSDYHQRRKVARRRGDAVVAEGMPERLWLALDEAHVVVPSDGVTPASAPLVDYVKRGRDSGLSLIFATQQPSAVDGKLMSQADITLTHGLSVEMDIQAAARRMPADASHSYSREGKALSSLSAVIRSLASGEVIVADSASTRIVVGSVRPRLTAHGGNTPGIGT